MTKLTIIKYCETKDNKEGKKQIELGKCRDHREETGHEDFQEIFRRVNLMKFKSTLKKFRCYLNLPLAYNNWSNSQDAANN